MSKKDKLHYIENADSLWKLFEKTGNVSYYLLYRRISGEENP